MPFLRTKVALIYNHFDILTIKNIFKLELLKFIFSFRTKTIPKCLCYYFQPDVQIHNYSTKFAVNNLAVVKFNKISTQLSIRYTGSKFWDKMAEKIKSICYLSHNTFVHRVKKYLWGNQIFFFDCFD